MLAYYQELDEKSKPFSPVCGKYVSENMELEAGLA